MRQQFNFLQNMLFIEHYTRKDQWKVPVNDISTSKCRSLWSGIHAQMILWYNHKVSVETECFCAELFAGSTWDTFEISSGRSRTVHINAGQYYQLGQTVLGQHYSSIALALLEYTKTTNPGSWSGSPSSAAGLMGDHSSVGRAAVWKVSSSG